uniref:Uncharacterized protein n=1 Tax=Kalanchoe fedtschenkoi TaxID=63787 RepID=A0A7N0RDB3_KALFE
MNMSVFSFFDAVSAESFGFKFGLPPQPQLQPKSSSSTGVAEEARRGGGGDPTNQTVTPPRVQKPSRQEAKKKSMRFAPELDGVNCFETMVRY